MKLPLVKSLAALAAALGLLVACGGNDGGIGGTGVTGEGTLNFQLTDAPSCGFDHVFVTVEKVRIHPTSATAADNDGGWREVALAPAQRIDLLTLTNGTLETLGQLRLPAGTYSGLRLVLAENSASQPLANAVTPTGGSETGLDTPSGQQSGLKVNTSIEVPQGQEADVIIDFDACQSVLKAGNSGKFILKPQLRVTTVLVDAGLRIHGWIADALAATTRVSAQQGGTEFAAAQPRADGSFTLYPLPEGAYDLVVTGTDRATTVIRGVPSVSGTPTELFSQAAPLAPAAAASGVALADGTVDVPAGGLAADVAVRVVQVLTNNTADPTDDTPVEIARPGVVAEPDAATGTFQLALPIDAPQVADYVAPGSVALTAVGGATLFVADDIGSRYEVQASFGTAPAQVLDFDAATPAAPTFTFP